MNSGPISEARQPELLWVLALAFAAAAVSCLIHPLAAIGAAGTIVLAAASLWLLRRPDRWVTLFLAAALCLPPLPIALGDSGPHPAVVIAALGIAAGILRWREWRSPLPFAALMPLVYVALLAASLPLAGLYSGSSIALASTARLLLFAASVYLFYYVAGGPGSISSRRTHRALRILFAAGAASAAFGCFDFYFQLPTPAGFGPQFIWLDSGVYRRAQGLFYEASTLGNVCAFFLVFTAVALTRPAEDIGIRRLWLLLGAVPLLGALLLSFSRASLLNLAVSIAVLAILQARRFRLGRLAWMLGAGISAALAATYALVPVFVEFYWLRIRTSADQLLQGNDRLFSGRLETWVTLGTFLVRHPEHALLGVGYKTLPYSDFIGQTTVADNAYLSALVETGVIGLTGLLALHAAILTMSWRARNSDNRTAAFFGTWIFCFWCGEMVQMLSGDLLTYWRVLPVYFWVLAIAVRMSRHGNDA